MSFFISENLGSINFKWIDKNDEIIKNIFICVLMINRNLRG